MKQLQCKRPACGHKWYRRRPQLPKVCPKCKRKDWNKEPQKAK